MRKSLQNIQNNANENANYKILLYQYIEFYLRLLMKIDPV